MIENLTACFDGLVDPRVTHRCDHRLIDILVIAVSAVIACAESWEDIELYGRSKQAGRGRIEQVFGITAIGRARSPPVFTLANRYAGMVAPGRGVPQL